MYTTGHFFGARTEDPHANIRNIFAVRANQRDGLASILNYCQKKSGFTVGSSISEPLRTILTDEFAGIVNIRPSTLTDLKMTLPPDDLPTAEDLQPYFQIKDNLTIYIILLQLLGYSHKSIIQFVTKLDGDRMSLDIDETHTFKSSSTTVVTAYRHTWIVNRDEMARRADWLVEKLRLKESLDDWNRRITSPEFQGREA